MTKERTALILLDFQNEFAKEGGKLHNTVADMINHTGMLGKVPQLTNTARESGILIVHSPVIMKTSVRFKDDGFDPHSYAAMDGLFTEGTWNSQFIDEIQPRKGEEILDGRNNFSAFEGTRLLEILKHNRVTTVIAVGFLSNICILETMRAAVEKIPGIKCIVCADGCAAKSLTEHDNVMNMTFPNLGIEVTNCAEVEALLRSKNMIETANDTIEIDDKRLPRILALHGARSNEEVAKLQLENLGITEEKYDIVFLQGNVEVKEGDPDIVDLIHGPYYSWFENSGSDHKGTIIKAIRSILAITMTHGPFDGVYGFSSGAAMAYLACNIHADIFLQAAIRNIENQTPRSIAGAVSQVIRGKSLASRAVSFQATKSTRKDKGSATRNRNKSRIPESRVGSVFQGFNSMFQEKKSVIKNFGSVETGDIVKPPFKFCILACSATMFENVNNLREAAGLPIANFLEVNSVHVPSFHIIGVDDAVKTQSEEFASLFADRKVMYIPGGHSIGREERKDNELKDELKQFIKTRGNLPLKTEAVSFKPISKVSNVALLPHTQVALVQLEKSRLPWGEVGGSTILSMLQKWAPKQPFLRESRVADENKCTTYGEAVEFIRGGKGDLRYLGVKPGEVVAYGCPPGGGAVPALAFLTIGAQTVAAPLAPGTTTPDALDALDQFDAKHLILFEGVDCPGVQEAFEEYAGSGKAKLHKARIISGDKPGMFEYLDKSGQTLDGILSGEPVSNPEDGTCLLLRTSGTTARPKGVPLSQDSLINNGVILAASLNLTEKDVCYSVMPLFHIGGISASILCTLATGGSVCCESQPFDPSRMVDALATSRPQPSWYSSVPTIHNATVAFIKDTAALESKYKAYGISSDGTWKSGHSLRLIRSGAAALLGPDGEALAATYGGVPIYPTYSMSEQMPISQPPEGKGDCMTTKPGSVGMPVAASIAIVDRSTLRPVVYGKEGEIAISGPTVLKNYLQNPDADRTNYFDLTLDAGSQLMFESIMTGGRYFLTGDVGTFDHEGFLSLKGRAKELIKKGGEQVSPYEVEEALLGHDSIHSSICFSVPSELYGEEVGCAIVLSPEAPPNAELREHIRSFRAWLKQEKLAHTKWPSKWVIVKDEELPKTKTKKYIRIGLSSILGLDPKEETNQNEKNNETKKARVSWDAISGFRFVLACYVMFMHIGSTESWGAFNNLRGFPWHVHVFYTLGGYSLASPMNPLIKKKYAYFKARIVAMYPMYAITLVLALINLLIVCRPSTFDENFTYNRKEDDLTRGFFCEGTPAFKKSYWLSLFSTIIVYIFGFAITPTYLLSWWLGYYLWFSSMYYNCLAFFPVSYNHFLEKTRGKIAKLIKIIIGCMLLNVAILVTAWFLLKDGTKYKVPFDERTHNKDAEDWNIGILSFYLVGPFWSLYFVIGIAIAFLYDAYRPTERHNAWIWGYVSDGITLFMLSISIAHICQGRSTYKNNPDHEMYLRPGEANQWTDTSSVNRIWDAGYARMFCPITTLWVFALSTGRGVTAKVLSWRFLSSTLAPHAYNCFLFHQLVGQWYYAATRPGEFWNWWQYRKTMYWFSPSPCPVEWYEYPLVVGLVVAFSHTMNYVEPFVMEGPCNFIKLISGAIQEVDDRDTDIIIKEIIEGMTGIEPELDYTLEECGLGSIGVPALVALLNKNFSKGIQEVRVTAAELVKAETIADIANVVDAVKELAAEQGV